MTKQELEQHNYYLVDTHINLNASMSDLKKQLANLESRAENTLSDMRDVADAIKAFVDEDEDEDLDDEEVVEEAPEEG